jgi:hypothetical protein
MIIMVERLIIKHKAKYYKGYKGKVPKTIGTRKP